MHSKSPGLFCRVVPPDGEVRTVLRVGGTKTNLVLFWDLESLGAVGVIITYIIVYYSNVKVKHIHSAGFPRVGEGVIEGGGWPGSVMESQGIL